MRNNQQDFNVDNWGGYAKCYDALNDLRPYRDLQKTVINQLQVSENSLILDVACGTGNLQYWLKKSNKFFDAKFVGLDFSDEMLGVARLKNPETCFVFQKQDLNKDIPYGDETFDQIVSVNTLYALLDPSRTLSEFHRVLKKGGRLVLVNPKNGYENGLILKQHCFDAGPDELWLGIHLSEEKEKVLLEKAVGDSESRSRMLAVAKFNRVISQEKKFHFFSAEELQLLIASKKFSIIKSEKTYASQAIILVAQK